MRLPTFMLLGAAKAGTTALYYYLRQHPDIFMSYPPAPIFIEAEFERGAEYYWSTYFNDYRGQKAIGEAGHHQLGLSFYRIRRLLPDAKFILICREPAERAFSHYWYLHSRREERLSFEQAIEKNLNRLAKGPLFQEESEANLYAKGLNKYHNPIRYPMYIDMGYYAQCIEPYIAAYGAERVKILFTEDLARSTAKTMEEVFDFLEVERIALNDLSPQNQPMPSAVIQAIRIIGAIPGSSALPAEWRDSVKRRIGRFFAVDKPRMSEETRRFLVEHFRPHNARLAELAGRNLDHWNEIGDGARLRHCVSRGRR